MRFGYALCLVASVALALWAGAAAWSDFARFTLDQRLDAWERQGQPASTAEWEAARDEAMALERANPRDAESALALARLYEWRAWQQRQQRRHARARRREADGYYLEAVERRPSWGVAWARMALNRAKIDAAAADTHRALARALDVDPYLPTAQIPTFEAGLRAWAHLTPELRAAVTALAGRMALHRGTRQGLQRLAREHDWQERLDAVLAEAHAG